MKSLKGLKKLILSFSIKKFRNKLLILFILLFLFPLIATTIISNIFFTNTFEKQATQFTQEMISQVQTSIESYIRSIDDVITYLSYSSDIINILSLEEGKPMPAQVSGAVLVQMSSISKQYPYVDGIMIASENGLFLSDSLHLISGSTITEDAWYQSSINANGNLSLFNKPQSRSVRNNTIDNSDNIVALTKAIVHPVSKEIIGIISIDVTLSKLESIVKGITLSKSGYVFISDNDGNLVYGPNNDTVMRIPMSELATKAYGKANISIDNKPYQLLYSHSAFTNWNTVGVFELGIPAEAAQTLLYLTIIAGIIFVTISVAYTAISVTSISRPIDVLRQLMKRAEDGELDIFYTPSSKNKANEIDDLGISFNVMIKKIRESHNLAVSEMQSKREAEIKTLQSQIKPHFLYNTLDTLQWMARERHADDILKMVKSLTSVFRISISRGREFIPILDELEHTCSYLYIQKTRYEDKLFYTVDAPAEVMELPVLKLLLQPLVENSIYHGIKPKRGSGKILIKISLEDNVLLLDVIDDGVGMSEELTDNLNMCLKNPELRNKEQAYGIFNVNDRIVISFGNEYGLQFLKSDEGKTIARIKHPVLKYKL